jgi:hypothetical protein
VKTQLYCWEDSILFLGLIFFLKDESGFMKSPFYCFVFFRLCEAESFLLTPQAGSLYHLRKVDENSWQQKSEYSENIVVYLLKARTVEAEKEPLLGNGPYTRSRRAHNIRHDITQQ